jgi:hypothetical protein
VAGLARAVLGGNRRGGGERENGDQTAMNTSRARCQSARGLAQSKTWRTRRRPRSSRSVLDCGSPLPLFRMSVMTLRTTFRSVSIPRLFPKRQRTGALQNVADCLGPPIFAKRLGLRLYSPDEEQFLRNRPG